MNPPLAHSIRFQKEGWDGWILPEWQDLLQPHELLTSGKWICGRNTCSVRKIITSRSAVYSKLFHPQTAAPLRRFFHTVKSFLQGNLVKRIARIHNRLSEAGIGCAPVLLIAWKKDDLLLVTEELSAPSIQTRIHEQFSRELLQKAIEGIRTLHDKGFVHGDCLPGNILLSDDQQLYYLDNDRTVACKGWLLRRGRFRNLVQFCSHLKDEAATEDNISFCVDCYIKTCYSGIDRQVCLDKIAFRRTKIASEIQHQKDSK